MTEQARKKRNAIRLRECHPNFAARLSRVISDLEAKGVRPRIQDAWRSPEAQGEAFDSGHSQFKFGFHNITADDGTPEALAVDLLDDSSPLKPSIEYLLQLAAACQARNLETGILWGLPNHLQAGVKAAIQAANFTAKVKVGWDPTHVQPVGISLTEAKQGKRPD